MTSAADLSPSMLALRGRESEHAMRGKSRDESEDGQGSVNPSGIARKINSGENYLIESERYLSGYA